MREIKSKIETLIENHPLILKNPKAEVFINNFTDTAIHFSVRIWTQNGNHQQAKSDLLEQSKDLINL